MLVKCYNFILFRVRASAEKFPEGATKKDRKLALLSLFRERGDGKNIENSTFKPLLVSTTFVPCMKIQEGHGPHALCCRRLWFRPNFLYCFNQSTFKLTCFACFIFLQNFYFIFYLFIFYFFY